MNNKYYHVFALPNRHYVVGSLDERVVRDTLCDMKRLKKEALNNLIITEYNDGEIIKETIAREWLRLDKERQPGYIATQEIKRLMCKYKVINPIIEGELKKVVKIMEASYD